MEQRRGEVSGARVLLAEIFPGARTSDFVVSPLSGRPHYERRALLHRRSVRSVSQLELLTAGDFFGGARSRGECSRRISAAENRKLVEECVLLAGRHEE